MTAYVPVSATSRITSKISPFLIFEVKNSEKKCFLQQETEQVNLIVITSLGRCPADTALPTLGAEIAPTVVVDTVNLHIHYLDISRKF